VFLLDSTVGADATAERSRPSSVDEICAPNRAFFNSSGNGARKFAPRTRRALRRFVCL